MTGTLNLRVAELQWLSKQQLPVWGGHLERGGPVTDPMMRRYIEDGLIEAVESPCRGYVITEKGRQFLRAANQ